MELKLNRISSGEDSTLGNLYIDGKFECFTLEDQFQEIKVPGETRIPADTYIIKKLKQDTPLTLKYKKKYKWFDYHLEICDIPNYTGVYMHVGNRHQNTAGCPLLGDTLANNQHGDDGFLGTSTVAYKRVYEKVSDALNVNEPVRIIIENVG